MKEDRSQVIGSGSKPWPGNIVMVVCGNKAHIESFARNCRDCGATVYLSHDSARRAQVLAARHSISVDCFCLKCATQYDPRTVTHFEDHTKTNNRN